MASDKIRVSRLSHVHYKHPNLAKALKFFGDFGLVTEVERDGRIYAGMACNLLSIWQSSLWMEKGTLPEVTGLWKAKLS
jgi:hypothetical protein